MEQQKLLVFVQSLLKSSHDKFKNQDVINDTTCNCNTTKNFKVGARLGSRSCCSAVYVTECSCGKEV